MKHVNNIFLSYCKGADEFNIECSFTNLATILYMRAQCTSLEDTYNTFRTNGIECIKCLHPYTHKLLCICVKLDYIGLYVYFYYDHVYMRQSK